MSGYVPNNRNERTPPPKAPYNGDFNSQQARPVEGSSVQPVNSLVGLRFIWDNGECLGANIPYNLTPAGASTIRGGLDARGCLTQTIQGREYDAQLLADADVDNDVAKARSELQNALDDILSAELTEAAELQAIQDQRSSFMNGVHKSLAFGKGLFMAGVGLIDSAKQFNDLITPHTYLSNALRAAWNAKPAGGSRWVDSFLQNFSDEQHRELVEALGFDPSSITREQLADAYEVANFIYDDGPSKAILGRFAIDYAKAQNVEEMAEFGGGAAFEIVLTAILAVFTGGIFIGIKAATSLRHLAKLKRLGTALTKLSAALKRARIKTKGKARGNGTGAQTVEVARPKAIDPGKIDALVPSAPAPGTLSGQRTKIPKKADEATRRSLILENEAADVLVDNGLDVAQNPSIPGTSRNPDLIILKGKIGDTTFDNEVADVFSPGQNTSARNIRKTIDEKVNVKQQADTIVLNMNGSDRAIQEITDAVKAEPVANLKNIIIVKDKSVSLIPIGQ